MLDADVILFNEGGDAACVKDLVSNGPPPAPGVTTRMTVTDWNCRQHGTMAVTSRLPSWNLSGECCDKGGAVLCPQRVRKRVSMDYLRVLIIDDSLIIRAMLEELIEREGGCRVVGMASSANDARSMMTDLIPTVVTFDLNMPGIDGLTFLDEPGAKVHVPVVVVSSATSAGSPQAAEAINCGAYACFGKAHILSDTRSSVRLLKAATKDGSTKAALSASV